MYLQLFLCLVYADGTIVRTESVAELQAVLNPKHEYLTEMSLIVQKKYIILESLAAKEQHISSS